MLEVKLEALGGEVIVEDIDVVDNPRLDAITVSTLLVMEGNKNRNGAIADDVPVCALPVEPEV